ncbi:TolC family protein, partial [Achromobacter sp. Marseille-Q0513]|uniref:TolC family protein n=1 Tax=Achromobacter sp. Marseille-Q0513 TaxID=2829161 RepID=UPI001B95B977
MYRRIATLSAICGMALLSACSVAPEYAVPRMTLPAHYKYALSEQEIVGDWQEAQPADASLRGEWWRLFDDPALNLLQDTARLANPSLQSALARLKQARALRQEAKGARFPRLGTGFGLSRERPSPVSEDVAHDAATPFRTKWRVEAGISYEADLF